jgi:hypothetical protein
MKYLIGVIFVVLSMVFLPMFSGNANADNFLNNHIIDDSIFNNANSMAVGNINAFLNQFPQSCISPNNGFSAPDPTGYSPSAGFTYGGNVSAGQVIYDAAQAYGINPQVLISTLEKESSVVTGAASYHCQYINTSMGYGCPDSGSCPTNPATMSGFSKQVIHAAWLFKFGEQRSEGNINWAVVKGNWNNSDDPQTCYGGPMTQGTWQRCPSGATAYYDGYTSIDGTAVHMDNGATATLYWYTPHFHGNQLFFNIFTGWFGSTSMPAAFKTSSSSTVYLQASGYKFTVPSMALLQDYGIEPSAVQTVSQATADSIPSPDGPTGLSTGLSYIVKSPSDSDSDGGAIYLVSAGKRYAFTSMAQFNDFAYSTSDIAYLPLSYIYQLSDGGAISNFITTPSQNVFKVSGGKKQIIFDYATYRSLNSSGNASFVSNYAVGLTPSGNPIVSREITVGFSTGAVYLFSNDTYYAVPSMDTYDCWGFAQGLGTPLYKLADDSFIGSFTPTATLSCSVNNGSSNYLLNGSNKVTVPQAYGLPNGQALDQNLTPLINSLTTRSNPLGRLIKSVGQPPVWYIESGLRKSIPSMTDFNLLGYNSSQIDTIAPGAVGSLPSGSIKLGLGQVVKSAESGTVFVVTNSNTRMPFASGDDFTAYRYSWSSIESFPATILDQAYPNTNMSVNKYLYDQSSNSTFLVDAYGCYSLSSPQLTSYGQSQSSIQAGQNYQSSLFPYLSLSSCRSGSVYVKGPDSGTVYWIDGGQKHPVSSWNSLVSKSGTSNPYIITLSNSTINTFSTGAPL